MCCNSRKQRTKQKQRGKNGSEKIKEAYEKNPKRCKGCEMGLAYEKRLRTFCEKSCRRAYAKRPGRKQKQSKIHFGIHACRNCNIENENKRYCNPKCFAEYKYQEKKKAFLKTGIFPRVCSTNYAKRYMVETFGHQCSICKITHWNKSPIALILDHIDGNSENGKIDNIRLICPNCDAALPTFKNKNKGKGRQYRRIRYALGKTY